MLQDMLDLEDIKPATVRPLMREEYDRLIDLGVFDDEKIELLRGVLVTMSPQGEPHWWMMIYLTKRIVLAVGDDFDVCPAGPLCATADSEPEPDLYVMTHDPGRRTKPTTALLVIEISNSSLRKDRKIKQGIYAEAGVPEYWIIDVSREGTVTVEVYTEPDGLAYKQMRTLHDGDVLRALHVPIVIPVAELPR
jgi:Uma2 family endonuclease